MHETPEGLLIRQVKSSSQRLMNISQHIEMLYSMLTFVALFLLF